MSGGVPAGWVLVPVEPTEAMLHAAFSGFMSCETHERSMFVPVWEGMLSAVPTPTPPIEGRDADVERVEVVARAMYEGHKKRFIPWGHLGAWERGLWLSSARAAQHLKQENAK